MRHSFGVTMCVAWVCTYVLRLQVVTPSTYVMFTVEALLCSGADACTADSKGRTPLHFAVTTGNCTLGKVHTVRLNSVEVDVVSIQHSCVCEVNVSSSLLTFCAQLTFYCNMGQTPIKWIALGTPHCT